MQAETSCYVGEAISDRTPLATGVYFMDTKMFRGFTVNVIKSTLAKPVLLPEPSPHTQ